MALDPQGTGTFKSKPPHIVFAWAFKCQVSRLQSRGLAQTRIAQRGREDRYYAPEHENKSASEEEAGMGWTDWVRMYRIERLGISYISFLSDIWGQGAGLEPVELLPARDRIRPISIPSFAERRCRAVTGILKLG